MPEPEPTNGNGTKMVLDLSKIGVGLALVTNVAVSTFGLSNGLKPMLLLAGVVLAAAYMTWTATKPLKEAVGYFASLVIALLPMANGVNPVAQTINAPDPAALIRTAIAGAQEPDMVATCRPWTRYGDGPFDFKCKPENRGADMPREQCQIRWMMGDTLFCVDGVISRSQQKEIQQKKSFWGQ